MAKDDRIVAGKIQDTTYYYASDGSVVDENGKPAPARFAVMFPPMPEKKPEPVKETKPKKTRRKIKELAGRIKNSKYYYDKEGNVVDEEGKPVNEKLASYFGKREAVSEALPKVELKKRTEMLDDKNMRVISTEVERALKITDNIVKINDVNQNKITTVADSLTDVVKTLNEQNDIIIQRLIQQNQDFQDKVIETMTGVPSATKAGGAKPRKINPKAVGGSKAARGTELKVKETNYRETRKKEVEERAARIGMIRAKRNIATVAGAGIIGAAAGVGAGAVIGSVLGGDGGAGPSGGSAGPAGGGPQPEYTGKGVAASGSAKEAIDFFVSKGWTKAQAIGIAANIEVESKFKTNALGDSGKAYGIAQWHPDRQNRFKQIYNKDIRESNFQEQLEYVNWELNNTEKKAGDRIRQTQDAASAAAAVDQFYERSSGAHRQIRVNIAQKYEKGEGLNPTAGGGAVGVAGGAPAGGGAQITPAPAQPPTGTGGVGSIQAPGGAGAPLGSPELNVKGGMGGQAFAGGDTHPAVLKMAGMIQSSVPGFNRFTAFNDKYHEGTRSKHAKGLAGDFTISDPRQSAEAANVVRQIAQQLGASVYVIDEYKNPSAGATAGHIHYQFMDQQSADLVMGQQQNTQVAAAGQTAQQPQGKIQVASASPSVPLPNIGEKNTQLASTPQAVKTGTELLAQNKPAPAPAPAPAPLPLPSSPGLIGNVPARVTTPAPAETPVAAAPKAEGTITTPAGAAPLPTPSVEKVNPTPAAEQIAPTESKPAGAPRKTIEQMEAEWAEESAKEKRGEVTYGEWKKTDLNNVPGLTRNAETGNLETIKPPAEPASTPVTAAPAAKKNPETGKFEKIPTSNPEAPGPIKKEGEPLKAYTPSPEAQKKLDEAAARHEQIKKELDAKGVKYQGGKSRTYLDAEGNMVSKEEAMASDLKPPPVSNPLAAASEQNAIQEYTEPPPVKTVIINNNNTNNVTKTVTQDSSLPQPNRDESANPLVQGGNKRTAMGAF